MAFLDSTAPAPHWLDSVAPAAKTHEGGCHKFEFGGVSLEVLPEPGIPWELPESTTAYMRERGAAPTAAAVTCSVRLDASLTARATSVESGGVLWDLSSDGLRVQSRQVVLQVVSLGPQRFAVAARIGDPAVLPNLLTMLAVTVAELAGALCLHATAVALGSNTQSPGRALLLLGPSGAGKTTAAQLLGDVSCLSNDRVVVVPDPLDAGQHWVWSLPVGMAPALPPSEHAALPLAGVLRVVQAAQGSEAKVVAAREVEALLFMRQAVEVSLGSSELEPQRLAALAQLASAAISGVAHIPLSPSWRPALDAWLGEVSQAKASSTEQAHG